MKNSAILRSLSDRHDSRRERAGAFRGIAGLSGLLALAPLADRLQDLRRGIVVVQHLALSRLPDQLLPGRFDHFRRFLHHLPLRRCRQRDPQALLQLLEPMERHPGPVPQQPDHARRGFIPLARPHPLGGLGREHLAAEVASPTFQFVDSSLQRRLSRDANQDCRLFDPVDLSLFAFRATLARLQRRMLHYKPAWLP